MHTPHYFSHFPTRSSEKKRHRPLTQYCLQCTSTGTFVDVSCAYAQSESLFQSSSDALGAMLSVNRCFNILIFPVILLSNATVSTA